MKKLFCGLILGIMFTVTAFASDISVTVNNTPVQFTDAAPYINSNGRVMVPVRAVAEILGCDVTYEPWSYWSLDGTKPLADKFNVVSLIKKDVSKQLKLGDSIHEGSFSYKITVFPNHLFVPDLINVDCSCDNENEFEVYALDGSKVGVSDYTIASYRMDTAAVIKKGRTYLPIRFIAEPLGYQVSWDNNTKTVAITDSDMAVVPNERVLHNDRQETDIIWGLDPLTIPGNESSEEYGYKLYDYPENP